MKKQKNLGILVSAIFGFLIVIGSYLNYKIFPSNSSRIKIGATYMTMNNSLRHGRATEVQITMLNKDNYILLIQDNGIGNETIQYGLVILLLCFQS